ncbi:MAG: hypothetical protein RL701_1532, partial [Pseudomonadota bacterium]
CLGAASYAQAQDNPELGDVRHNPPPATASAHVSVSARADNPFEGQVATAGTRGNDHSSVVGHLGIGVFGPLTLPYGGGTAGGDFSQNLSAPTIGARYWLDERLGLEGAVAIGFQTSGTTTQMGNTSVEVNNPSVFGFGLHAGLPLVFASSAHFAFELVPELNFGFVTGGVKPNDVDVSLSGVLLQLGARIGAEIQFGFIGIPQLALQGTVGFHLQYEGRGASTDATEVSSHSFGFGTTVQGKPWDIFTSNISAIYYL